MERQTKTNVNRVSYALITIATLTIIHTFLQPQQRTCLPPTSLNFPNSSCHASSRTPTTLHTRNAKLWSSHSWHTKLSSYAHLFHRLPLRNDSAVLCLSAGAGHAAAALASLGVGGAVALEVAASPPLVARADPHRLPFNSGAFDLAFSDHLALALYPDRVAAEMERTVRAGGVCVLVVDECGDGRAAQFAGLFRGSEFVEAVNVTLSGLRMTRIVVTKRNKISS